MITQNLPTILNWLLLTFLICSCIRLHRTNKKAKDELNKAIELVNDAKLLNEEIAPVRKDFLYYVKHKKDIESLPEIKKEILQ